MLKATHTLSNLEKHQMQQILSLYPANQGLLEEKLRVIEEEKDYVMEPYYLYYQEGQVTGFVLIEYVVGELLQAKIYVEQQPLMDLVLRQLKSYLRRSKIETALFCMDEGLDLEVVKNLTLSTCEYQMECEYDNFLNWSAKKNATKSKLRWLTKEDETFYKDTLETTFFMEFEEREDRFSSLKEDFENIKDGVLSNDSKMAGVILETLDGNKIGIGGCYVGNRCITLFDIAVLESYQGQGYGNELLRLLFEKTKHLKKNYLLQVSSESKNAVALYQSIGFKIQEQLYCYKMKV